MPLFDVECDRCGQVSEAFQRPDERESPCACGGTRHRVWLGHAAAVIDDTWVGGKTFENLGHEPVTCYSRTEYKRELAKRSLQEKVRHVGRPGGDRSEHTSRWI